MNDITKPLSAYTDLELIAELDSRVAAEAPTFDEGDCAQFIFDKLLMEGTPVALADILQVLAFEYDYGVSIGIYPKRDE